MKRALDHLPALSEDDQAIVAEFILGNAGNPIKLSAAERVAVDEGFADSGEGKFAPSSALDDTLSRLRNA